jgi:hypothetical protein
MAVAHGERFQCALGPTLTSLPGGGTLVLDLNDKDPTLSG